MARNICLTELWRKAVIDFHTYVRWAELPPIDCNPITGNASADSAWNCSLCGNDKSYGLPLHSTDSIYFFSKEHDYISADWKNPTAVWFGQSADYIAKLSWRNCTGGWTAFSDWELTTAEGWNGVDTSLLFNFQVAAIDVSKLIALGILSTDNCCLQFKIEYFNAAAGGGLYKTIYSEYYMLEVCIPSLLIEGIYDNTDCEGYYYGLPAVASGLFTVGNVYSNIVRVYGKLQQVGNDFEVTKDDFGIPTAEKVTKIYELRGRLIPPFLSQWLARIYGGRQVVFDGSTILYLKDSSFSKQIEYNRMWRLRVQFSSEKCKLFFGCV